MTMLLLGSSGVIEASGLFGASAKVAAKEAAEAAVARSARLLATEGLGVVGTKALTQMLEISGKLSDDILLSLAKNIDSVADDLAKQAGKSVTDMGSVIDDLVTKTTASATKLDNIFSGKLIDPKISKLIRGATNEAGDKALRNGLKEMLPGVADDVIAKTAQNMVDSQAALLGKFDDGFLGTLKTQNGFINNAQKFSINNAKRTHFKAMVASGDPAQMTAGLKGLRKFENPSVYRMEKIAGKMQSVGSWAVIGMAGALLFMLPNLLQTTYLAQQAHNAMLQTYLPPIKFGNVVLQLPDSVVNMVNPVMSQFIYYGIPVDNPGQGLSKEAKAMYPGVSGPSESNKLSKEVHNKLAQVFSGNTQSAINIKRYNLDAQALATLPIFVSYSDSVWSPWASAGIQDPMFSQKLVNLNTGSIVYADGTSGGMPPAPLIGPKANTDTVQSFLHAKMSTLIAAGKTAEFKDFVQVYASAKADEITNPILNQFNCACLETNGKNGDATNGVLTADAVQYCTDQKSCLLSKTLNQLAAGLVINSQGQMMSADQDLATEMAQGALGQVIPIQGYGANFDDILQMFPGAQQDALANSGALTVSLGSDLSSASTVKILGADPDNYTAKGVYVYQCKNTPLAKILKSQSGGSASIHSQITDFIVFLDGDLNQVPMMAPVADLKNYGFISMGLNPAIKYFSTVLGSFDGNGQFNFLPQLNIQSPAALVAKGLPASFPPLYGLKATNGSLAVNYNQNLTSAIGGVVQGLMNNPKLGQQFKTMQSAMMSLLGSGPYGQYNLQPVPAKMQPAIGGVNLMLYTGFNGYPVSQDQANANCSDVLIPLSAQGKTVTLPSNNVAQYYGLVTDLTYSVQPDGSITVGSTGFAHSPLSATGTIDQSKAGQFYWIDKLTAMGQGNDPQFEMPQPLVDFVEQARSAWINWVKGLASSGLSPAELMGIQVAGTSNVFTTASQQALKNGFYLYSYSPCPSSSSPDYFVLTNSSAPQASDSSLGKMSATKATAATNMLSIVSGLLYNSSGNQVKSGSGAAYTVDPNTLLQSLNRANPNAFSNDLKIKLNISAGQAASAAMEMVYPFAFADLQLGLYQADINIGVYLYFDAAGAGASADFQPSDYFATLDSYTAPKSVGTKLSANTPFVVSLVSGQVYDSAGVVAVAPASIVKSIVGKLAPQWRSGVAADIASLTAQLANSAQNDAQTTAAMDAVPVPNSGIVTFSQAAAQKVIANLASVDYLIEPYDLLKQDPASGVYVLVTPANQEQTQFIYTFFNVPSTILDVQGNPTKVGAIYDEQGNLLRVIKDFTLACTMQQYGVAVDSNGKQYLGASNSLPILQLDAADLALKPGMSGKSMLCSNDANFPSYDIVSPIAYQNSQFYFYYNTNTKSYYAMQVTGSDIRYIDMAGGCVYNLNGSPRIAANPVAVNSNGDVNDLFLSYTNPDNSFVRCFMKNIDNNGLYSDFYNYADDFSVDVDPATNNSCGLNLLYSLDDAGSMVNVAQMPFAQDLEVLPELSANKQYNVYFGESSTPITYNVNATYTWQNLQILPIDMKTRALLPTPPADIYMSAGLVSNASGLSAMMFAGTFYSGAQQSGAGAYTMKSGTSSIVVSMQMDSKTNAQYVQVVAGGVTYNYQCSFLTLSDNQLEDYHRNVWQSGIVADVTGNILLEKYINIDASGNLQLVPVSMKNVTNVPTDAAAKSALSAQLGNILQDAGNGNFMTAISAGAYPYFTQDGYVDLENGVLFDATGMLIGYTLQYVDFMKLVSQLQVVVIRDAKGKSILSYRAPMTAPINAGLSSLSASYTPAAASSKAASSSAPTYNAKAIGSAPQNSYVAPVASSSGSNPATLNTGSSNASSGSYSSYVAPVQNQPAYVAPVTKSTASAQSSTTKIVAPAAPVTSADTAPVYSNNPKIAKLQQQNVKLQADTEKRQKNLKTETIAHRKKVLQNAIATNQDQIALNNKQIADLAGASSTQAPVKSRATVLGRLSSKLKKNKN